MRLKSILLLLFTISWLTTFGQTIKEVQLKMLHNPNLPSPRVIIDFSKNINSVSLNYKDVKNVTPEKLKQVANVEFVELGFENQLQLNELVGFLSSFKNLKYLSFTYDDYFSKESTDEIFVPNEVANLDKIIAVKFAGKWKVNFHKSFETLKKLPSLSYYLFQSFNEELPKELLTVKVKGISLHSEKKAEVPMWITDLQGLETLSISMMSYALKEERSYVDYNKTLSNISMLPSLKSLYIGGLHNVDSSVAKIRIPLLEELSISGGDIKQPAAFFEFVGNLSNLRSLTLHNIMYDTLKRDLVKLKHLKLLNLRGTYEQHLLLGFALRELQSLRDLTLNNFSSVKNLNTFPPKVENLLLSENKLSSFPAGITKLKGLRRLELAYNSIDSLPPNIGNLKSLNYLNLESNQLKYLPDGIGKLTNLKLIILKANPLKLLPENTGSLSNLETLDVSFCDLTKLPSKFSSLTALRKLDVSYNFLTELPDDFFKLASLDSLSLAKNALTVLPTEIGRLKKLRYLNLVSNNLNKLPESFGQLKRLEELNLSANDLVELPSSFKELSSIQTLYLSNSKQKNEGTAKDMYREIYRKDSPYSANGGGLNHFAKLPDDLSQWSKLKKISLSNVTSLGNDALLALQTVTSKGYSIELENGSITQLPKNGWQKFNVGVLNLRNNSIEELPVDIINASFLRAYNFNQNHLPTKPINQNSSAANKYEKLLWFNEFGLIPDQDLPKIDSMALAYIEKSSTHYYRKEHPKSLENAQKALNINPLLAEKRLNIRNIGESKFFTENYKGAVESFTKAIKVDTAGGVRIMNFVIPDFTYRAKSYLKLGDTLSAINDYKILAEKFHEDTWGDIALLYKSIGDKVNAEASFKKGIKQYSDYIGDAKKRKYNVELKQLSLLELIIIAEDFKKANEYATNIQEEIKGKGNKVLFDYLDACAKIGVETKVNLDTTRATLKSGKKEVQNWGYELFFKWLRITKIDAKKALLMRELTDLIKPIY